MLHACMHARMSAYIHLDVVLIAYSYDVLLMYVCHTSYIHIGSTYSAHCIAHYIADIDPTYTAYIALLYMYWTSMHAHFYENE